MEGEELDDAFVDAAPVRERDLHRGTVLPMPSRESLREVKREARRRRQATGGRPPRGRGGRRSSGRDRLRSVVVLTVLALLAVGIGYAVVSRPRARPVPVVVPSFTPPPTKPADPFDGTAVAAWPVGAAGVRGPAAKPVAGYFVAQVADAYAKTARYLKVAMLDRRVLYDGALAPVHKTLLPASARAKGDPTRLANRFRPGVAPASPSVRVNGFMASRGGPRGSLLVDYTYVATYALRTTGNPELVAVRRRGTLWYDAAGPRAVTPPWLYRGGASTDHSRCGVHWPHEGYLEVYLSTTEGTRPTDVPLSPLPTFNMLDPKAKDPTSCFDNTGEL